MAITIAMHIWKKTLATIIAPFALGLWLTAFAFAQERANGWTSGLRDPH
jgi:hypothetical protein